MTCLQTRCTLSTRTCTCAKPVHTPKPYPNPCPHRGLHVTLQAQGALGELRRAAARPPPKATLPVKGGKAHQGLPGFVNFDQPPATELPTVQKPTFVFFDALTAHEIRQDAVQLTPAQLCGEQPVPKEFTRSAEFPMFVSELLHGTPHLIYARASTTSLLRSSDRQLAGYER